MAISKKDSRLLEEMQGSAVRAEEIELSGRRAQVRNLAVEEVREQRASFKAVVSREDSQEVAKTEAVSGVSKAREAANNHFATLYSALDTGLSIRVAQQLEPIPSARDVEAYLHGITAAGYARLGRNDALSHLERALGMAERFVPDGIKDQVIPPAQAAYDQFESEADELSSVRGQWNEAQAALVEARVQATAAYLGFRDILSGLLRMNGREDRLNQYARPLHDVFYPGGTRASAEDDSADTDAIDSDVTEDTDGVDEPALEDA